MKKQRHKRKNKYTVLLVSNLGRTKELHALPRLIILGGLLLTVLAGCALGLILHQQYTIARQSQAISSLSSNLSAATSENQALYTDISSMSSNIVSLNAAIMEKDAYTQQLEEDYNDAQNEIYALYDPTGCPVTGTATVLDEKNEVFPADTITFEAYKDANVISSGAGTVIEVDTKNALGNLIVIDHGNGYTSYYYSVEEPEVTVNQKVNKGDTLFHIRKTTENIEYRLALDQEFIDPWDKLEIFG